MQGCFCNPGFIRSPTGCVRPHQCGCRDSRGKYHSLNATFWEPEDCGQLCGCGPVTGEVHCRPARCPRGMVCKQLHHRRVCQPENPLNCTIVTGLHFTTFDGHHFDFRDSCAYSLVQTKSNLTGQTPFSVTISDASCRKRLFHSLNLTLSIYGLEVAVRKDDPGKVLVSILNRQSLNEPLSMHFSRVLLLFIFSLMDCISPYLTPTRQAMLTPTIHLHHSSFTPMWDYS